jgi:hypothetical protein
VSVINLETKIKKIVYLGSIKKGHNPFARTYDIVDVKKKINDIGNRSCPRYKFILETGKKIGNNKLIRVVNLETNEMKDASAYTLMKGNNPFSRYYSESELKNKINRIGIRSSPVFEYICDTGETQIGNRLMKIQNKITKEFAIRNMQNIFKGSNPWNEKRDQYEVREIQPLFDRLASDVGIDIESGSIQLFKGSIADRVIILRNDNRLIVEIKSEKHNYTGRQLRDQLNRYEKYGRLKYKKKFFGVFLASPNGKYGMSFKDLFKEVLKINRYLLDRAL